METANPQRSYLFVEFDRTSGMTTMPRPMSEFPSPADLRARYERIMGFSLDAPAAKPLLARYPGGEGQRRYFQDAAIRAVLERVAHGQTTGRPTRALLSLATGTGKTFIACNLLKRITDAGQLKRALFLCDRDELRTHPNIWHGNALTKQEVYGGLFAGAPSQFDVVLTNPPFGGKESVAAQTHFAYRTSATQVLFLQHVIEALRTGGRYGMVIDEGVLFRTNEDAFVKTKRKLTDECALWCVLSLPGGVFSTAGAGVKTNLLFFTKGSVVNTGH